MVLDSFRKVNKSLSGTAREGAQQLRLRARIRPSLSLPASHHHLNVFAFFLFLLRRRTRLGRHDSRAKTCRPSSDSDAVRTGRRFFSPGAAKAWRAETCSSASPRSTQASRPWTPPRKIRRGQTSSAQKSATIRRLKFEKEDDLGGQ